MKRIVRSFFRRFLFTNSYKIHYLKMVIDPCRVAKEMTELTVDVKKLNYDDFKVADKRVFNTVKLELYKTRFEDGSYCAYGVFSEDKLVYSSWVSYNKIGLPIESHPIFMSSTEGYLEDDYCMPEYRGRGIHTQVMWFRLNEILKSGRKEAVITIMDGNDKAIKPAISCGFKDLGTFKCGKIFGKKFSTLDLNKFNK